MLVNYGMDENFGLAAFTQKESENGPMAKEIQDKVNMILKEQMVRTVSLIKEGKERIDKLVAALLEKNKLTRGEIEAQLSNI